MIYLATASGPAVCQAIEAGHLGQLVTPHSGNRPIAGARWALDNGAYSSRWDMNHWSRTLDRYQHLAGDCLWAVVPDVVGDHDRTVTMWRRWWSAPIRRGYRNAWVAQDGCWFIPLGASALFIGGGTTAWKYSPQVQALVELAKQRSMWVHMGRVNSLRRLRYAHWLGCDSVDGTFLTYAPDINLPKLLRFLRLAHQPTLPANPT